MTKLFQQGIEAVRKLPAERRDLAGELLLSIAGIAQRTHRLTAEQIEDLKAAIAEADGGNVATDGEINAAWKKFGL